MEETLYSTCPPLPTAEEATIVHESMGFMSDGTDRGRPAMMLCRGNSSGISNRVGAGVSRLALASDKTTNR
jgi:hypothetical protein